MRHNQIVTILRRCPLRDVAVKKIHLIDAIRQFIRNAPSRPLEHPLTGINAVYLHARGLPE